MAETTSYEIVRSAGVYRIDTRYDVRITRTRFCNSAAITAKPVRRLRDQSGTGLRFATLPPKGNFQKLEMAGPTGLQTKFRPSDPSYLGGRWWLDVNGNNEMDTGDMYFLCPLLAPGYTL